MIPRIDSHQHFWRLDRGDYRWLSPALGVLYHDYLPPDLEEYLDVASIDRTIAVQAADSIEETRFLLSLAQTHEWIAAVVGWIDFEDPDAPATLADLAQHAKLRALRPMIQDIPDPNWMLRPDLAPAFDAVEQLALVFDALVKPPHLDSLITLARSRTNLRIIIDHGAKPAIGRGRPSDRGFDRWASRLRALSELPNTCCKLSGLATEADERWSADTLRPYADHLLACFGPERLLWGSDWPVVNLAGGYGRWWSATLDLISELSDTEQARILGGTAARVYGIEP
ncbi:MAG: amidohydrolase family protein [Phycisphaerales bacterium]|nr:amidohydrolase family protein [Phycisphaerales bacterium]